MVRGKCALRWLCAAVAATSACTREPCESASPTLHLELVLAGVMPDRVRSLEILLDAGDDRFRRIYNVEDQLVDGRTSLSVEIDPAPTGPFELGVDVRAFDAMDAGGELLASRAITMQAEPNGCNDAQVRIESAAPFDAGVLAKDGGGIDAEPEDAGEPDALVLDADAGEPDAEAVDAEPVDAEPIDAEAIDAEPLDAEPLDAEPMDAEPDAMVPDLGVDAGCLDDDGDGVCNADDNCPDVPNALQEDADGVAAFPIPFAPIAINGQPVPGLSGDDDLSDTLPIGFGFEFFGAARTEVRVSSNGFISFMVNSTDDGCCEGQALPDGAQPNNLVALAWNDLDLPVAMLVTYEVLGSAPDRMLVVAFDAVPLCCGAGQPVTTAQAILFESSNRIEVHTTEQPPDFGFTRGVEAPTGARAAYLPGESRDGFALTDDAVAFTTGSTPDGIGDACSNAH